MPKRPRTVVVDLDGTISVRGGNRDPFDLSKVHLDKPIHTVINVVYSLECQKWTVVYLTARGEECRKSTKKWLDTNVGGLGKRPLFMRSMGDKRDDATIKFDIYKEKIEPDYRVELALDDNLSVVQMWRGLGIQAFHVAEGL